jgi:dihydrodipicolinate synthase/N-acetylneuraminate lyase
MSGLTGVMPEAVRLLMGAFRAGNHDLARRMQYMFLELLELAEEIPFPEGLKVLLEIRGFEMGPPLRARSAATHRAIEQRRPELARKIESILEFVRQEATA